MQNVEFSVEKDTLVIKIDLKKAIGPSQSGKTILVASTNGNAALGGRDGLKLGLNVFRPNPDYKKNGGDEDEAPKDEPKRGKGK